MTSRIKQERLAAGLTQTQLGDELGVTLKTVANWERDASSVKQSNLIAMSRLFGCSVDWLVGMSDVRGSK